MIASLTQQDLVWDHDLGQGHLRLVLHTEDPQASWDTVKAVIPRAVLPEVGAFYSVVGERKEHSLWPPLPGSKTQGNG
jgi:hypothetical protein